MLQPSTCREVSDKGSPSVSASRGTAVAAECRKRCLAGIAGRTVDCLSKVENNRIDIDRLSVIRPVVEALEVTVGDLVGEPALLEWDAESGTKTVAALREALLNYRQLSPFTQHQKDETPDIDQLTSSVRSVWTACRESRYGYVVARLPELFATAQNEADETARPIGRDGNHLWTAFAPTNVGIHRVTG